MDRAFDGHEQQRESGTESPIEADVTLTIVPAIIAAVDALAAELELVKKELAKGRRSWRESSDNFGRYSALAPAIVEPRWGGKLDAEARWYQQPHSVAVLMATLTCTSLSEMTWVIGRSKNSAGPTGFFLIPDPSRTYERRGISVLVIVTSKGSKRRRHETILANPKCT